jgi:hypothetical protein
MLPNCHLLTTFSAIAFAICFINPNCLNAAPPTLTSLFPAGGQQGKTVEVTASGNMDPWPVQAWCSGKGIGIKAAKEKGKFAVAIAADVSAGFYWMRLTNADGASEQRPFFVGSLPEVLEAEPNDDPKKPQALSDPNVVVNGRLNPVGDVDHFAVELKKGQTLVASLQAYSVLRSPMDGVLQILSADGFVLAENNDTHGLDPQLAFPVPRDGRYLVRVFAFPAMPDSSIQFFGSELCVYRLTLTTGGYADYAFPLAVALKQPALVAIRGWNIPEPAKKISVNPDRLVERFAIRHPGVVNPVFVRVEPHACIAEVEPNDRARPQTIETPATISGRIDPPRDVDAFSLILKKGERRQIQVEARALGSPLDPVLAVFASAGKMLNEIDDTMGSADPELLFTAPVDGSYRIEVRDRFQHGGERYFYRLRVAPPEPDFTLTLTADQFALTAGEPLEIPITVNRLNGHAQPIELRAVELPAGVECEPVKADAAAKTAKLKLTAKKDAVAGPFRIEGSAGLIHEARAALPAFGTFTDSFWLTVRPGKK